MSGFNKISTNYMGVKKYSFMGRINICLRDVWVIKNWHLLIYFSSLEQIKKTKSISNKKLPANILDRFLEILHWWGTYERDFLCLSLPVFVSECVWFRFKKKFCHLPYLVGILDFSTLHLGLTSMRATASYSYEGLLALAIWTGTGVSAIVCKSRFGWVG